jgi:putative ATP-dependent endonuclease of OLD family
VFCTDNGPSNKAFSRNQVGPNTICQAHRIKLIGANNSGKTTIVEALALLLGGDRLIPGLTRHDFYGSKPEMSDRVEIIGTVNDFEPNDQAHHLDWFRQGRGAPN